MDRVGFYQIVYSTYKTNTNKDRIKKQFVFLDEVITNNTFEKLEKCKEIFNRYKNYNNVVILDYDKNMNAYIFSKSKKVTLKLHTKKDILQDGERIEVVRCF